MDNGKNGKWKKHVYIHIYIFFEKKESKNMENNENENENGKKEQTPCLKLESSWLWKFVFFWSSQGGTPTGARTKWKKKGLGQKSNISKKYISKV